MKRFYWFGKYPYNTYGNAIALKQHLDYDWMKEHLVHEELFDRSSITGHTYSKGMNVIYMCSGEAGTEKGLLYSFKQIENRKRIIELLPHMVEDPDPLDMWK